MQGLKYGTSLQYFFPANGKTPRSKKSALNVKIRFDGETPLSQENPSLKVKFHFNGETPVRQKSSPLTNEISFNGQTPL